MTGEPLQSFRKWAITVSVMVVTVMQVLDTSITNVALPHMQGSALVFMAVLPMLPFLRRVRAEENEPARAAPRRAEAPTPAAGATRVPDALD
ncbi:MAG: hypothetical protein WEG40_11585 [Candidatus Rokuibacteriota bacterium]